MVIDSAPETVLDVGPGYGKAGILLREYVPTLKSIDAIELEKSYITPRLYCLYDHVAWGDIRTESSAILNTYDLILIVDVIEHLEKQEGLELLARLTPRIVVCTPKTFFENPPSYESEVHRSLWSLEDFGDRIERHIETEMDALMVMLSPQ